MHGPGNPQVIAGQRYVKAGLLLSGQADLRGYPHRYLAIISDSLPAVSLTELLASAELLEQWGWELMNVTDMGQRGRPFALMRRRS